MAAQGNQTQPHQYHHYQLVDVGTFGGPQSWQFDVGAARLGLLNNQGMLVGSADTLTVDPYCFWSPDCYATDALQWQNGGKTDLGVLPGGIGSQVIWISENGLMVGISDNGQQNPLHPAFPQLHAVLWERGEMTDLGTLAGGYESSGNAVNRGGEIVGQAYNTIPDPNSLFGYGYQSRAFYWNNGAMQDLGTLGTGTDAMAGLINEQGQVVGRSYTSSVLNALCPGITNGAFTLATGSFLWDRKNGMKDIGGLGGTCTLANDLNNHGQIVGGSALTGDTQVHPFVWNAATGVTDLLNRSDSSYGFAEGENAHGDVAGGTCSALCHAVLWRKTGGKWQKTNLSTIGGFSFAISIDESGQVVGNCGNGTNCAFLWEDGGPIVDLNNLVPPGSGLQLIEAHQINDRGQIAIGALDANGNNHSVLLIPCDENHPGVEGCDYSLVDAAALPQSTVPSYVPNGTQRLPHLWRSNRFHVPSHAAFGGAPGITTQVSPVSDFTRPPVFYVSATPLTPSSVNPGGSSTSTVTVYVGTNPVTTAALSCSVQPSRPLGATCSINPTSAAPAMLRVSTFGPSGRLLSRPGSGLLYALWLPLIGLVATGVGLGSNQNGQKRKPKTVALACALLLGLTFQTACGGSHSSGTPAGTYTITVTATAFVPVNTTFTTMALTVQ
jgi:probable HAF family extracellular repeat protein